jgi:hypothetical protein
MSVDFLKNLTIKSRQDTTPVWIFIKIVRLKNNPPLDLER